MGVEKEKKELEGKRMERMERMERLETFFSAIFEPLTNVENYNVTSFLTSSFPDFNAVDTSSFSSSSSTSQKLLPKSYVL